MSIGHIVCIASIDFQLIYIRNKLPLMPTLSIGTSVARVDRIGAYVDSLQISGRQIIMPSPDGRETHGGCAVLIPYANRVRNAVYVWGDKTYILPRNDGLNSIHGLVRHEKWSYENEETNPANITELKFELRSASYPSPIAIKNRYELGRDFFDVDCTVTNSGDSSCPLLIGFHPYFLFSRSWHVRHDEELFKLQYRNSYFPSGEMEPVNFNDVSDMQDMKFDNCFKGGGKVTLHAGDHDLLLERRNMDYLVIYNGDYSQDKSVAIEPMTGAPDAFNNGLGLVILEPQQHFRCGFRVSLIQE